MSSNGESSSSTVEILSPRMPWGRRFTYSVGHVLNDLCASMWFTYLLVFFHYVVQFSNEMAGYLMLLGQVADAICTPLVGYEMDHTNGFCGYTKRKSWHLIGTICVMCSFPFFFMTCIGCADSDRWAQFIYFAPFLVLSQFGWASTQISHLALIPELTSNQNERVLLNAMRYAFTVLSNLTVYSLTWFVLSTGSSTEDSSDVTPDDAPQFRILILSVVGGGVIFSIIFHLGTKECKYGSPEKEVLLSCGAVQAKMTWRDWLKEHQFYLVGILYMCTRLAVNVSQIYLPMYLTDSLFLHKKYIAIVPLVVYLSGFLVSFIMGPVNQCLGRKFTYFLGTVCFLGASAAMWFIKNSAEYFIFGPAFLLGAGGSILLITSLSIVAELIGSHTSSGAFVYGAMSFTDKLSNGLAVLLIQTFHPCKTAACCPDCVWYYKYIMVFVPAGVAAFAIIILLLIASMTIGQLRFDHGVLGNKEEQEPLLDDEITEDDDMVEHVIVVHDEDEMPCCFSCCGGGANDKQQADRSSINSENQVEPVTSNGIVPHSPGRPHSPMPNGVPQGHGTPTGTPKLVRRQNSCRSNSPVPSPAHYGMRSSCGAIPNEYAGRNSPMLRQRSRESRASPARQLSRDSGSSLHGSPLPSPANYGMRSSCGAIPAEYIGSRESRANPARQLSRDSGSSLHASPLPSPANYGMRSSCGAIPAEYIGKAGGRVSPLVRQVSRESVERRSHRAASPAPLVPHTEAEPEADTSRTSKDMLQPDLSNVTAPELNLTTPGGTDHLCQKGTDQTE